MYTNRHKILEAFNHGAFELGSIKRYIEDTTGVTPELNKKQIIDLLRVKLINDALDLGFDTIYDIVNYCRDRGFAGCGHSAIHRQIHEEDGNLWYIVKRGNYKKVRRYHA